MEDQSQRKVDAANTALTLLGAGLLALGVMLGWGGLVVRWAGLPVPGLDLALTPLGPSDQTNVNTYLGADLAALAVIIVLVIGFNASLLQVAGRSVSLALTRAILYSIGPYLVCWGIVTGVELAYVFRPPIYLGQIWQSFAWFFGIILLMLDYLRTIPSHLSGEYAASWALRDLSRQPIAEWESLEGYSVLQTSFNTATALGDLGSALALARAAGRFLVLRLDSKAEHENRYVGSRFRSLKNLITGCSQNVADAPNQFSYYLGILSAATLLQGVAVHASLDDTGRDLFSGVFRAFKDAPERINPFWSGVRHALCQPNKEVQGEPFLRSYWRARRMWPNSDLRLVDDIAVGALRVYIAAWRVARQRQITAGSNDQGHIARVQDSAYPRELTVMTLDEEDSVDPTTMLTDLFKSVATLGQAVRAQSARDRSSMSDYPVQLLDALYVRIGQLRETDIGAHLDQDKVEQSYLQVREAVTSVQAR